MSNIGGNPILINCSFTENTAVCDGGGVTCRLSTCNLTVTNCIFWGNGDSGGYDDGGAYWGHGAPLYWAESTCGKVYFSMRAHDREAAKTMTTNIYPKAKFFR